MNIRCQRSETLCRKLIYLRQYQGPLRADRRTPWPALPFVTPNPRSEPLNGEALCCSSTRLGRFRVSIAVARLLARFCEMRDPGPFTASVAGVDKTGPTRSTELLYIDIKTSDPFME